MANPTTERDDAERGRDERVREEHRTERSPDAANKKATPPANRDQDPNHPANRTLSPDPNAPTTFSIPPGDMMTEQEKSAAAGEPGAGVGPVSLAEVSPGPVQTIEEQGIGPRTPYPEGNPPPPEETITRSQGIKGVSDKPHVTPGESKGPARPNTDAFGNPIPPKGGA
jgi:hypothetical protein